MIRFTLIKPALSGNHQHVYINSLVHEPLTIATLAGLTPAYVDVSFYDDRLEPIPYDAPVDIVGLTVDTYSAKRAYAIATEFRKRNVTVILGGWHPTFLPKEAEQYADVVVIGEAEDVMEGLFDDYRAGALKKRYFSDEPADLTRIRPRRDLFVGKPYVPAHSVEFGRGCKYRCDFCCIHRFYHGKSQTRPVRDVVEEIAALHHQNFIFADDNLVNNPTRAKELFRALAPLGKRWGSQSTIDITHDPEMMRLARDSGCVMLLIGFESSRDDSLAAMNKRPRLRDYERAIGVMRKYGIAIDGSFVWGYDNDTRASFEADVNFAIRHKFLFAGFNPLMPYPGTEAYHRLADEDRLLYDRWWIDQEDFFGSISFRPTNLTADDLAKARFAARKAFYHPLTSAKRILGNRANVRAILPAFSSHFRNAKIPGVSRQDETAALPSNLYNRLHQT